MIKVLFLYAITFVFTINASAQECGPSCPVCSGSTDGSLLAPMSFMISSINIPGGEEETSVFNLRYGLFPRFDAGVGYAIKNEKFIWSARFEAISEEKNRPGIILGTGSVRTGKSDQSLYLHLTKSWEFSEMFAMRITTGIASLVPELDKIYGLGGITFSIADRFSPFISYDGINYHEGMAWIPLDWLTVSALLIESEDPALSIGIKHSFPLNTK